jgi:hypothetical protein
MIWANIPRSFCWEDAMRGAPWEYIERWEKALTEYENLLRDTRGPRMQRSKLDVIPCYTNTYLNLGTFPDGLAESAWLWLARLAMVRPVSPCPGRKLSPYLPAPNEFADIAESRISSHAFGIFIEIAFI